MEGGVPKAKLQISIPKNFQRITAEDLASLLFEQRHSGVLVVDVRGPDFHGGRTPSLLHHQPLFFVFEVYYCWYYIINSLFALALTNVPPLSLLWAQTFREP